MWNESSFNKDPVVSENSSFTNEQVPTLPEHFTSIGKILSEPVTKKNAG
jgi:hypothetical protein